MRQEIDGLQARHLQLASCLHFLRQEVGELQVRHFRKNNRNSVKNQALFPLDTLR